MDKVGKRQKRTSVGLPIGNSTAKKPEEERRRGKDAGDFFARMYRSEKKRRKAGG